MASPLIEQVMLVGQDQRQLGALLPPGGADPCLGSGAGFIVPEDLGGRPGDPALLTLLMRECNRMLQLRPGARGDERLCGVGLVEPFSIDNGLLTQTLKQRRDRISRRDAAVIEQIYPR